jgi:hypothetical protein
MTTSNAGSARGVRRSDGWWGIVFVVLVFASSATVSLPSSADPPGEIARLYAEHRTGYVVAQLIGLLGVVVFVRFLLGLLRDPAIASGWARPAGLLVALAAIGTNVSVLVLCFDPGLSSAGVQRAAAATDITDDVLFASYALFFLAVAVSALPSWLRAVAGLTAVLCLVRAIAGLVPVSGINIVAPVVVLLAFVALAVRLLRLARRRRAASPGA